MQSITQNKKADRRAAPIATAASRQNTGLKKMSRKLVPGKSLEQIRRDALKQLQEIGISFI